MRVIWHFGDPTGKMFTKTSNTHRPLAVIVVNVRCSLSLLSTLSLPSLLFIAGIVAATGCTGSAAGAVGIAVAVVAEVVFAAVAVADACISDARGLANKLRLRLYRHHFLCLGQRG